ncbi:hypothetical protein BC834DRAFT_885993 [Gloeopeniophorella convolvens]|nr:hypothetical protein BC834DRAFT_885993 [Gloeopeniophorella convolvens]
MADAPGRMRDEEPVEEQLAKKQKSELLTCKRSRCLHINSGGAGGAADADEDAGGGMPKRIGVKGSQKTFGEQHRLICGTRPPKTRMTMRALEPTKGLQQKLRLRSKMPWIRRMRLEEASSMTALWFKAFHKLYEGHAADLRKGKGRASPAQGPRSPSSAVGSGHRRSMDNGEDDGPSFPQNQIEAFGLYGELYPGYADLYGGAPKEGSDDGEDVEGGGDEEDDDEYRSDYEDADPPAEPAAEQERAPLQEDKAQEGGEGLANGARLEKPVNKSKVGPLKPSKRQERLNKTMAQEVSTAVYH